MKLGDTQAESTPPLAKLSDLVCVTFNGVWVNGEDIMRYIVSALALSAVVSCGAEENAPLLESPESDQASLALSHMGSPGDVMLQAFAWQSKANGVHGEWYDLLRTTPNIDQFGVVWLPPASKTIRYDLGEQGDWNSACGYMPLDLRDFGTYRQWVQNGDGSWYQHAGSETLYGSESELRSLINSLHSRGVKVLADVIVNHRAARQQNSQGEWAAWGDSSGQIESGYYPWGQNTNDPIQLLDASGGSGGSEGSWSYGGRTYANTSTGYAAEIAHWNTTTRDDIKSYLLALKELGFDGFRWDLIKGFDPAFLGEYGDYANSYLSVGEWYDYNSRQALMDVVHRSGGKTMTFDFDLKGDLTWAVKAQDFGGLAAAIHWWPRTQVTFVDNHDTGRSVGGGQQHNPIEGDNWGRERTQAYAYILTHPGIPSVYWYHWQDSGAELRAFIDLMVATRKAENVVADSALSVIYAAGPNYEAVIGDPAAGQAIAVAFGDGAWDPSQTHGADWTEVYYSSSYRTRVWRKD
ncbi:MAG: alpha-amylase family glycosyl hydrolase [Myxococcota bacterium]